MSNIYKSDLERSCDDVGTRDEYITPEWVVNILLNPLKPWLKDKKVLCPCDDENSAWVQWCKKNNVEVKYSHIDFRDIDKETVEWADIIITNPPFSLKQIFLEKFRHKHLLIMGMMFFMATRLISELINAGLLRIHVIFEGRYKIRKWLNVDKSVMGICTYTNIPKEITDACGCQEYFIKRLRDTDYKKYIKDITAEQMKAYKRKKYAQIKRNKELLSQFNQNDNYYGHRHNVYINENIWKLYKMQSKWASVNEILSWYFLHHK